MKRREKEANARALASVLNCLLQAYTYQNFTQDRYRGPRGTGVSTRHGERTTEIQKVRMSLWDICENGIFRGKQRESLKKWFEPVTYRRLFAMSSEPLWDGLPPVDYIAAMIAYKEHPQYKLLDLVKSRIEMAREYVGDKSVYSNEWRALAYLRSHPLVAIVRPKYVEILRPLLEESEYLELKDLPSLRDLIANQPVNKITLV